MDSTSLVIVSDSVHSQLLEDDDLKNEKGGQGSVRYGSQRKNYICELADAVISQKDVMM